MFTKRIRVGKQASSYTAEVWGLHALFDIVEAVGIAQGNALFIFTDSQGVLAALAKGIRRQTDSRLVRLWKRILKLNKHGVSVHLRFIYGHTQIAEPDRVDEDARRAAARGADSEIVPYYKDAIRAINEEAQEALNRAASPQQLRLTARVRAIPSTLSQKLGIPSAGLTVLCQLRTNACPAIGGHLIGPHRCSKCGAACGRGQANTPSMVEHMFVCPRGRTTRANLRIRGLKSLWQHPHRTLRYATDFFRT